jgi:hypothetical protein
LKQKNENYYKFINANAMALQDFPIMTFENYSKNYDFFNPLSINQIKKRDILSPPRN